MAHEKKFGPPPTNPEQDQDKPLVNLMLKYIIEGEVVGEENGRLTQISAELRDLDLPRPLLERVRSEYQASSEANDIFDVDDKTRKERLQDEVARWQLLSIAATNVENNRRQLPYDYRTDIDPGYSYHL